MSNEPKHTATPIETIEEFIAREGYKEGTVSQEIFDDGVRLGANWQSEKTKSEIESLRAENAELIEALKGMVYIVQDSSGVYGYHKNGDLADWDEFNEVDIAQTTLAKYEKP